MDSTERRNKIFLIGNGFDLSHGLPTRYVDFITWYLKDCCLKAIDGGVYSDDCLSVRINKGYFYGLRKDLSEQIESFFEKNEIWGFVVKKQGITITTNTFGRSRDTNWSIKIEPKNEFCSNLLSNCLNADWSGIEFEINRIMLKEHSALIESRTKIMIDRSTNQAYQSSLQRIKLLNSSIYHLKSKLIEYLSLNNNPEINKYELLLNEVNNEWGNIYKNSSFQTYENGKIREIPNPKVYRSVLFLNFNYTTYFEHQIVKEFESKFEDEYTDLETIFIHGDLGEPIDNIVFGVGDENKETYSEIESLYDNDWLVPLKTFNYFRNEKYQQLLGFIAKGDYDIYVIGHSCSTTDRTLLNMLFENDACKKINVYHYSGIDSYLATSYNIARNFNDKVRLRKVLQPFNPNLTTR